MTIKRFGLLAALSWLFYRSRKNRPFVGCWVDTSARRFVRELAEVRSDFETVGMTDLCMTVQRHPASGAMTAAAWDRNPWREWRSAISAARDAGVRRVGFMLWPQPTAEYIQTIPQAMDMAREIGFDYVDFDFEDPWYRRQPRGYASRVQAALALEEITRANWHKEVTGSTFPAKVESLDYALEWLDTVAVQAYTQREYGLTGRWGIPGMQEYSAEKVAALNGPKLVLGAASYRQNFDGTDLTPEDVMVRNLQACWDVGAHGVRYWSWKWIWGHNRSQTPYARRALLRARDLGLIRS